MKKIITSVALAIAMAFTLSGCWGDDDATVVSENISKAADNFEVERRVVMLNGITDEYLLVIEGRCNIVDEGHQLEVTCKVEDGEGWDKYKKHFLGLSDNVTYFVEQGDPVTTSAYHYRVTFKPQTILPDIDARGSLSEGPQSQD